jgi:hypothetical protein
MNQLLPSYQTANSPDSDINADGISNLSDLAILMSLVELLLKAHEQ